MYEYECTSISVRVFDGSVGGQSGQYSITACDDSADGIKDGLGRVASFYSENSVPWKFARAGRPCSALYQAG